MFGLPTDKQAPSASRNGATERIPSEEDKDQDRDGVDESEEEEEEKKVRRSPSPRRRKESAHVPEDDFVQEIHRSPRAGVEDPRPRVTAPLRQMIAPQPTMVPSGLWPQVPQRYLPYQLVPFQYNCGPIMQLRPGVPPTLIPFQPAYSMPPQLIQMPRQVWPALGSEKR